MKTHYRFFFIIVSIMIGIVLNVDAKERQTVLRLGLLGNKFDKPFASGVIGFAQENQSFEQEFAKDSISVQWNFFKGGAPALNEAIANGVIDIASYGDLGSISGKGGGLRTKVLFPTGVGGGKNYILVSTASSIQSFTDLKGKRISYQKGTAPQLLWNRIIRDSLGLKEKDFRVFSLGAGEQEVALACGQIDILLSSNLDLVDRNVARILLTLDLDANPKLGGVGVVVATESFIAKHPDIVQRWVNVYVHTASLVLDDKHRDAFVRVNTKAGSSGKTVRGSLSRNIEYYNAPIIDDYFRHKLQLALDDCLAFRFIPKPIFYEQWVEPAFINKAIEEYSLLSRWSQLRQVVDLH